mmetsp:Transcript_84460/g.242514  ORF Transcript_84460/g.242514 Transcript_84460/m.242514 type:complete len:258 (-) Transcript_84460:11-784(-)
MCLNSGLLRMNFAGFRSSQGSPVRRSRRASHMWTLGWLGKTRFVVCKVLSSGEVSTTVGKGKPEEWPAAAPWVSRWMTSLAERAWFLPASESAASRRQQSLKHARRASSTRALNLSLFGHKPRAFKAWAVACCAFFSSMLCTASPCLTRKTTFLATTPPPKPPQSRADGGEEVRVTTLGVDGGLRGVAASMAAKTPGEARRNAADSRSARACRAMAGIVEQRRRDGLKRLSLACATTSRGAVTHMVSVLNEPSKCQI